MSTVTVPVNPVYRVAYIAANGGVGCTITHIHSATAHVMPFIVMVQFAVAAVHALTQNTEGGNI
jgi:hypothetical protein